MSYVTPAQLKSGLQGAKDYADSKGAGLTKAYIIGSTVLAADWLSDTAGGTALTPDTESVYVIQTAGDYFGNLYMWNDTEYYTVGYSSEGGSTSIMHVYTVGDKQYRNDWLGETADGAALNPQSDVVYVIETQGDYFGQMYYWNAVQNVYRLMGKKNIANEPENVNMFEAKGYTMPACDVSGGNASSRTYFSIPVVAGDVIHAAITGTWRENKVRIGFAGDSTVTQTFGDYSGNGTISYVKDIVVTEEIAALGVPFTVDFIAIGYSGQAVMLNAATITVEKVFQDYETPLFVPPTSEAAGKAGLVPGVAAGTTNRVLTQDGWDETPLDITSAEIKEAFDEVAGGSSDMLPNEYSTEERMIGHWIDGKPLYRKTFAGLSYANVTAKTWADLIDVSAMNIDSFVGFTNGIVRLSNGSSYSLPYNDATQFFSPLYEQGKIRMCFNSAGNGSGSVTLTIIYTKTTD